MIRFLLDFQTTDMIVITEKSVQKADFYYIADFLEIERQDAGGYALSIKEIFANLLEYWRLLLIRDASDVFLVYDLSDQYISAFHIETVDFKGRNYLKVTEKYTQDLSGPEVTKSLSYSELRSKKWEVSGLFSTQSNRKTILRGIDWSIENLRINTNPVDL